MHSYDKSHVQSSYNSVHSLDGNIVAVELKHNHHPVKKKH